MKQLFFLHYNRQSTNYFLLSLRFSGSFLRLPMADYDKVAKRSRVIKDVYDSFKSFS